MTHIEFTEVRPEGCKCPQIENACICKKRAFGVGTKKYHEHLGMIGWHDKWRCYVFSPIDNTEFSSDCLIDIVNFMDKIKKVI